MYDIEQTDFGYRLTFGGEMDAEEMAEWKAASERELAHSRDRFGVFVDMRTLEPLDDDAQEIMEAGQAHYRKSGMVRSAVILQSLAIKTQFKKIAMKSGIYDWERYIVSSEYEDWEQRGLDWVTDAIDPHTGERLDPAPVRFGYDGTQTVDVDLSVEYTHDREPVTETWRRPIEPGSSFVTSRPVPIGANVDLRGPDGSLVARYRRDPETGKSTRVDQPLQ